jgi:two-component system response regulator FlrC
VNSFQGHNESASGGTSHAGAILVVEDDAPLRDAMCATLSLGGYDTVGVSDAKQALDAVQSNEISLVLSDVQMPVMDGHTLMAALHKQLADLPVVLLTAYGSIEKAVEAMRLGAADYLVKPFEGEVLLELASRFVRGEVARGSDGVIAEDELTKQSLRLAERVAVSDATVMISGESGTGKEVFARHIHDHSPRATSPFIAINCAAIPESMLESILFGYEKGAFTGAYRSRAGKFEQANGGTLLLDEISEMDISLQAKLLRVLQEKEVERLGGSTAIPLDVRVLATTNRNLSEEVSLGRFREDLFYRLNVFPLNLPSLRQRRKDIMPLVNHFCKVFQASHEPVVVDSEATLLLESHSWPGNVRELENVVHRAVILMSGNRISAQELSFEASGQELARTEEKVVPESDDGASLENDLKAQEQQSILNALRAEKGNRQGAAMRLGISPRTLRYKLAKYKKEGLHLPELASL